jgi:hypothetical protein
LKVKQCVVGMNRKKEYVVRESARLEVLFWVWS